MERANEILQRAFINSCVQVAPSSATDSPSIAARLYTKLLQTTSRLCGPAVGPLLEEDDVASLFLSIQMPINGKWEEGVFVGLADRAILAWTTGTLRIRQDAIEIGFDEVERVEETERTPSTGGERVTLNIELEGGENEQIKVLNLDEGAKADFLASGLLLGAITYHHD